MITSFLVEAASTAVEASHSAALGPQVWAVVDGFSLDRVVDHVRLLAVNLQPTFGMIQFH